MPHLMPECRPNGESEKAEALFAKLVSGNFSYDDLSNHPDYIVYASAETLAIIVPQLIDEMLRRKDLSNYILFPLLSVLDPKYNKEPRYRARAEQFIKLIDRSAAKKIHQLFAEIQPLEIFDEDQISRALSLWNKTRE